MSPTARKLTLAGLSVALVAALIVTTLAVLAAARQGSPTRQGQISVTLPAKTAVAGPTATGSATGIPTPSPTNAPFVCANAVGSTSTYVFVNNDHQLYRVTGCSAPVRLTSLDDTAAIRPLAFSPTNKRLMVTIGGINGSDKPDCQNVMNAQTGALAVTRYCTPPSETTWTEYPAFVGWLDDNTFVEALTQPDLTVKVERVDATTLSSTPIATFGWVGDLATGASGNESGIEVRATSLFYGGYASKSEGGAWLHRYSLTDGSDTKLVPLGIAGNGGCQAGNSPCTWTGPWDVSPDGAHIAYHKPGPTLSQSDTPTEPGTPLYYARLDGSNAAQIFPGTDAAGGFLTPIFSPSGSLVFAGGTAQPVAGGAPTTIPSGSFGAQWRNDSRALLIGTQRGDVVQSFVFTLATKTVTAVPGYSYTYLWGM